MSVYDLKQALRHIPDIDSLTISLARNGNQILTTNSRSVEVNPMASTEEIERALTNPWAKDTTKMSGFEPGSIKAKLEALKHKAQEARLSCLAKLDEAGTKHDAVNAEIERIAAEASKEADDALQEFAQFTNGGPET